MWGIVLSIKIFPMALSSKRVQEITLNFRFRFANNWDGDFSSDEISTYLGPAQKIYEWDNKISHDPFFYHMRFRRSNQNSTGGI